MNSKKVPTICPSCESPLHISELVCGKCDTKVSGVFNFPALLALAPQEQKFVLDFIKQSGSLKDMSSKLGLSYPTVRNILDSIIEKINKAEKSPKGKNENF